VGSIPGRTRHVLVHIDKGKGKVHPRTGHEGPEGEKRYSSTLYLTSALDGGGWSTPRSGRFTPGKETRYPLYRKLGRPQGRSGRVRKMSPPPVFDPRTFQPVASSYIDYAMLHMHFLFVPCVGYMSDVGFQLVH